MNTYFLCFDDYARTDVLWVLTILADDHYLISHFHLLTVHSASFECSWYSFNEEWTFSF